VYSHWQYLHGERIKSRLGCLSGYKAALVGKSFKRNTVFPRIVSAETNLFWKLKLWKFSYNFSIMAIFYFINQIVAEVTIQGGKLFKGGSYLRKYGIFQIFWKTDSCPDFWFFGYLHIFFHCAKLCKVWTTSDKFDISNFIRVHPSFFCWKMEAKKNNFSEGLEDTLLSLVPRLFTMKKELQFLLSLF